MNAPQSAHSLAPALPDWLESGLAQGGAEVLIVARQTYRLHAVGIDQPLLVVPLAGTKRIRRDGCQLDVAPGRYLVVHRALALEVENLTAENGAAYRAWAIALPWRVVALARTLLAAHGQPDPAPAAAATASSEVGSGELAALLPALQHLLATLSAPETRDAARTDHALLGLALALARDGQSRFLHAGDPTLAARIRLLVVEAPAYSWVSSDFEQRLHVSGATLRRRLAEEGTSLRALLREARLHHGLGLLQTSRRPLKSVALACGYRSVPSFSRNFAERFGISPQQVANHAD